METSVYPATSYAPIKDTRKAKAAPPYERKSVGAMYTVVPLALVQVLEAE